MRSKWYVFVGVTAFIFALSAAKAFIQPRAYQATLTLLLEPDFLSVPTSDLPVGGNIKSPYVPPEFRDYTTVLKMIKSREVTALALPEIRSSYPDEDYQSLDANLSIRHVTGSDLVQITFQDTDPDKVEFVLDRLSKAYIAYAQKASLRGINQAVELVEEQLPIARNRVDEIQQELQRFRQESGFYSPDQQSQNLYGQLNSLVAQRRDVDASLKATTSLFQDLKGRIQADPGLEKLEDAALYLYVLENLDQEAGTSSSLANQALTALPDTDSFSSSDVVKLDNALELFEAKNNIIAISGRKLILDQEIQALEQEIQTFVSLDRYYTDLQRELEVSVASLNRLLATEEELRIEISKQIPPWEMITGSETEIEPVMSASKILVLGLFSGLLVGVGVTLVIHQVDDKYISVEEIRDSVSLPILGTVPFKKTRKKFILHKPWEDKNEFEYDSSFSEAFKLININLQFLAHSKVISSFAVSSALPGEGRTTVARFLAKSFCQSGKRILLIDSDFRHPTLPVKAPVEANARGLSDLIASEHEEAESFIVRSPNDADILLAGGMLFDPVQPFLSEKFDAVFEKLKQQYDMIIFDTPPLLCSADARLLSHKTDGLILVIGADARKHTIRHLTQELEQSRTSVFGVVTNGPWRQFKVRKTV